MARRHSLILVLVTRIPSRPYPRDGLCEACARVPKPTHWLFLHTSEIVAVDFAFTYLFTGS